MIIAGLQKTTLIDYPGKVAATVFTRGCSFRCGFCHNPELVLPEQFVPEMDQDDIFKFLEGRRGKLEGICITGGEPLLTQDTVDFMQRIKSLGFLVKLDTNGSFPGQLERAIKEGAVDYIAMDIKSPLRKYAEVTSVSVGQPLDSTQGKRVGRSAKESIKKAIQLSSYPADLLGIDDLSGLQRKVVKSINLIIQSGIDYEFRTTVVKPLHEVSDFELIGKMIQGAKKYYLQNFQKSKHIDETVDYQPFIDEELEQAKGIMAKYVGMVGVR